MYHCSRNFHKYRDMSSKPKVVKDFDKLPKDLQEQIKLAYPKGFHGHLVSYTDATGATRKALPYETEDRSYLIRMTLEESKPVVFDDDEDYDDGSVKFDMMDDINEKYPDMEIAPELADDDEDDYDDEDDLTKGGAEEGDDEDDDDED